MKFFLDLEATRKVSLAVDMALQQDYRLGRRHHVECYGRTVVSSLVRQPQDEARWWECHNDDSRGRVISGYIRWYTVVRQGYGDARKGVIGGKRRCGMKKTRSCLTKKPIRL